MPSLAAAATGRSLSYATASHFATISGMNFSILLRVDLSRSYCRLCESSRTFLELSIDMRGYIFTYARSLSSTYKAFQIPENEPKLPKSIALPLHLVQTDV